MRLNKRIDPALPQTARIPVLALTLCLQLALPGAVLAEQPTAFPGLGALMNDQDFDRSGLNKLSPTERAALNRWLAVHAQFQLSVVSPAPAADSATPGPTASLPPQSTSKAKVVAQPIKRNKRAAKQVIKTRIAGKFSGWTGGTIFLLENGQLWRQRQSGNYRYRADSPEVELFQNRLGLWEMKVLATGKRVKVSRHQK